MTCFFQEIAAKAPAPLSRAEKKKQAKETFKKTREYQVHVQWRKTLRRDRHDRQKRLADKRRKAFKEAAKLNKKPGKYLGKASKAKKATKAKGKK